MHLITRAVAMLLAGLAFCETAFATDTEIDRFTKEIRAAGASVGHVGVPGQFLSGRNQSPLLIMLDENWSGNSLLKLKTPLVRGISIQRTTKIDSNDFDQLATLSNLRYVAVDFGERCNWRISAICEIANLWSLDISGRCIDDNEFAQLAQLNKLEVLQMSNVSITNKSGAIIRQRFPALRHLILHETDIVSPISDVVPATIAVLSLRGIALNETDAGFLLSLKNLVTLDIRGCDISVQSLAKVKAFSNVNLLLPENQENPQESTQP